MEEDIRGKVIEKTYNGIKYNLYVPENVNENTPVFTYVHGSGGTQDWKYISQVLNENGSNSIVVMPTMSWNSDWETNTMEIVNSLKTQYGITSKNVSSSGFSMGGFAGYTTVAENIRQNPDIEPQIAYFIDDYSSKTYYNYSSALSDPETINLFKENETIFFIFEGKSKNPASTKAYGESGLNVIRVICANGNHVGINKDFFNNGIYDYMAGGKLPEEGYTYQRYNKETGKWENINYADIATKKDLYNYYNIDTFATKLKSLSSLGDITIESDDKTLESYLNEIRGTIRNTNFLQGDFSKTSYASTTKVPFQIIDVINTYFQATSSLLTKIANETTEFAKIAASYENLDFNLSQNVEDITTETLVEDKIINTNNTNSSNLSGIVGTIVGGISGTVAGDTINQSQSNSTNNQNNQTNQSQNMQSNSVQRPQQNTNQNTQQTAQPNTQEHNKPPQQTVQPNNQEHNQKPQQPEQTSPLDEFPKYEELYSDDTKIVYNCNDEYKIIIHKDGDKVIGIEHYYDFKTQEQATAALEILKTEYSSNENFDKIVQKDCYLKVLFKEESYHELTITDIQEEFIDLEEVIKGEGK